MHVEPIILSVGARAGVQFGTVQREAEGEPVLLIQQDQGASPKLRCPRNGTADEVASLQW